MLNFENFSGGGPPAHLGAIPYPQITCFGTVTAFTNNLKVYCTYIKAGMRRIARLCSVWYTLSFVQLFAVLHQCTLVPQSWVSPTKQINKIIVILQLCKNWSVRLMGSDFGNAAIFNDYKLKTVWKSSVM